MPSEPPPGHIPWTGEVSETLSDIHSQTSHIVTRRTSLNTVSSTSTCEIPCCDSATLLNEGSLPPDDSGKWSDGLFIPNFDDARAAAKTPRKSLPIIVKKHASATLDKGTAKQRRKTTCLTDISGHRRDMPVFGRRLTQDDCVAARPRRVNTNTIHRAKKSLSALDSFASQLDRIDLAMDALKKEKSKMDSDSEPPSLVVSTSRTTHRISVEDFVEHRRVPLTLASRRGKVIPGALQLQRNANAIDYPDIPTPFQCAATPEELVFTKAVAVAPVYPELHLDKKMSAEQMINSLRNQIENFVPRTTDNGNETLDTNVIEAETWLNDELDGHSSVLDQDLLSTFPAVPVPRSASPPTAPLHEPSMLAYMSSISREINALGSVTPETPNTSQQLANFCQDEFLSPTKSVKQSTPRVARHCHSMPSVSNARPRRSILSVGTSQTGTVRKKVRFTSVQPEAFTPPLLAIFQPMPHITTSVVTSPIRGPIASPPRRKPASATASPSKPPVPSQALKPSMIALSPKRQVARELSAQNRPPPPIRALPVAPSPVRAPATPTRGRFSTVSGSPSSLKNSPSPLKKKYSLSQAAGLPRGPLIFAPNAASNDAPSDPSSNNICSPGKRRQSQSVKGKENQRLFPGISITRKRSFTISSTNESRAGDQNERPIDKKSQKKVARRSMPFQSMLNRLRA